MQFNRSARPVMLPAERSDRAMGTIVRQRVYGIGGAEVAARVQEELARLEALWSVFRPDSEISALARNAGARAIEVHDDTLAVLAQVKRLHALTGGALDVTIGPLMKLWREAARRGREPAQAEVAGALARAGMDGLELGPGRLARLARAGQAVDLGAVGKGYAADRCVERYEEFGVKHALLDFGGHLAAVGGRPDGAPWRVGIQTPGAARGRWFGYLEVENCSVVTSGSYERGFDFEGRHYSHVLDPRTGYPVSDETRSATVVSTSSALADGLATACLILGAERGLALAQSHGAEVLLLDAGGTHVTPGLRRLWFPAAASGAVET